MTNEEARDWIADRHGRERTDQIASFLQWVGEENERQNLIAPSTIAQIWSRHAMDSAQLLAFAPLGATTWLDIGTGGGFPGMVVALLFDGQVTMVEPRKRRADFLLACVERLSLRNAIVRAAKVEAVDGTFAIISARAVALVEKLLQAAAHCAKPDTRWILPRGRIEAAHLDYLRQDRTRLFHVEHSLTDPQSSILLVDRNGDSAR